jgi:hypothetical protein
MTRFHISAAFVVACAIAAGQTSGPRIGGCPVLPADNIWNTPVDKLPVHASSATFVNTIGATAGMHADFGSGLWDGGPIGIPFIQVAGSQTKYPVSFDYADESDPGPYAVPLNAPIEGGSSSTGDRHAIAVDVNNCILYELYYAFPQTASWTAGSGAIYNLNSDALRPDTWTSADAAGLPIMPGLVRYDEVAAGEIRHAIRFTVPQTRRAYVWPARHYASSLTGSQYPPMGQRFRLKASFDISGFPADVQVILRALKKYGMILADNGSAWYISGQPDERWNNSNLATFRNVPGSAFEAVDISSLVINANSGQARQITYTGALALNRSSLAFGALAGGSSITPAQSVRLSVTSGPVSWTASSNRSWLQVSQSSGTTLANLTISIVQASLPAAGSYTGTVTFSAPQSTTPTVTLTCTLNVRSPASSPFGSFDTPLDQSNGLAGSIAVTGWALDNIAVDTVQIWRAPKGTEPTAGNGLVYIGDAVFVPDARPDVAAAQPNTPMNYRGGWGYLLLSNMLPNPGGVIGNGSFTLYAYALNHSGQTALLGTKTIAVDNLHSVKPFGAIDTPAQGETVAGTSYTNFGWALTPQPAMIPSDGSTIEVYIDGAPVGIVDYGHARSDIDSLFTGYANTGGAVGFSTLDTTTLSDGIHNIAWSVTDNQGHTDGIGSRYFFVQNTAAAASAIVPQSRLRAAPARSPFVVEIRELGRIEIPLPRLGDGRQWTGGIRAGNELQNLPAGSTLDASKGTFVWQLGPGFLGDYLLEFHALGEPETVETFTVLVRVLPQRGEGNSEIR